MIWAGIVDEAIIRPFKVDEGVEMINANYCNFMDKTFFPWYKSHFYSYKMKYIFTQDYTSSHTSKLTRREDRKSMIVMMKLWKGCK